VVRVKPFELTGKVALVTGSTKGIGKRIAEGFVAAGAKVYLHGRDEVDGNRLASSLSAQFIKADLSNVDDVTSLATRLLEKESHLDILGELSKSRRTGLTG
jgi:NAD(P)-dependent dehydrogenase (short-subunit alcohol dehydrogenase family)